MNESTLYRKLVDLYAGSELPAELEEEMEAAGFRDKELSHDMTTLRQTVELMRTSPRPALTEESMQRILMKLYSRGVDIQPKAPEPMHLQYHLPIAG